MTKFKYSPGPWRQNTTFPHKIVGPHNRHIATAGFGPSDQTRIDARLIAEAPAMLEALRTLIAAADTDGVPAGWGCVVDPVREIIARIEGTNT